MHFHEINNPYLTYPFFFSFPQSTSFNNEKGACHFNRLTPSTATVFSLQQYWRTDNLHNDAIAGPHECQALGYLLLKGLGQCLAFVHPLRETGTVEVFGKLLLNCSLPSTHLKQLNYSQGTLLKVVTIDTLQATNKKGTNIIQRESITDQNLILEVNCAVQVNLGQQINCAILLSNIVI